MRGQPSPLPQIMGNREASGSLTPNLGTQMPKRCKVSGYFQRASNKIMRVGVYNAVMQAWFRFESAWFDMKYKVDTHTNIPLSELNILDSSVEHGVQYQPILMNHLTKILDMLEPTPNDVLVDFGSGKGNVLLVSSMRPFKKVVGVEFSDQLCAIAVANIEKFRGHNRCKIEINCVDAGEYEIKNDETIFYFFNPFDRVVMQKVIDNIKISLSEHPRRIRVVHYNLRSQKLDFGAKEIELALDSNLHGMSIQIYEANGC